jgi:hypothetical protein
MRYRLDPPYPAYGHRAASTPDRDLRASDAERNEVADRLSRHFAEGRLDEAEFKLRLDRAMGAVTRGDLAGLFGDLPRLAEDPEPRPPRRRRHLILPVVLLVSVLALAVGSTASLMRVPGVLVVLAGLFLWYRARRRHGTPRARGQLDR